MRTLDPTFQAAMDSGNFEPIIRAWNATEGIPTTQLELAYYKIHNTDLEIRTYTVPDGDIILERGVKIVDTEYTIFSSSYIREYQTYTSGLYTIFCHLTQTQYFSTPGDITYANIINTVINYDTSVAKTINYKIPNPAWKDYKFLPTGKTFTTNKLLSFYNLLRQKYLIFATDNDAENILFFSAADSLSLTPEYTIPISLTDTWYDKPAWRSFIWRDETGSIHKGLSGYPLHNLGYLETTAAAPTIPNNFCGYLNSLVTIIANLKYQTGDHVTINSVNVVIDVTEIFAPGTNKITWRMEITPLDYFANTEGGTLPSTIERVAAYTPLVTTNFDNNLTTAVNNLQALAEAVDDLALDPGLPATTAANDFQVGNGAGAWIKKTLTEVKTILELGTAAYTAATDYITHALATAANDFLIAPGAGSFVKKTLAETLTILGKAAASGLASLDGSSKVIQDPANATATPTASKIPIADASAKLDGWITDAPADGSTKGKAGFTAADFNASSGIISLDYANGQKASDTQPGYLTELATATEINTGTDATRAISPDALAAANIGIRLVELTIVDYTDSMAVGDGKGYFVVPPALAGMNLVSVHARVITAGTTNTTDIQIANVTDSVDMLSTKLTIDSAETGSDTAQTPAVIDTTKDDVAAYDLLRVDVDAISTTAPKGLIVTLGFALP